MERYDNGATNDMYVSTRSENRQYANPRPSRDDVLMAPLDYRSMIGSENRFGSANDKVLIRTSPITLERSKEPRTYLNPSQIGVAKPVTVIDKRVDRIVEVVKEAPVDKVVESMRERLQVTEKVQERPGTTVYEEHPRIEERVRHIPVERTVYKEVVQEVVVDKVVDIIIEVIKEVVVPRVVERRVEIIQEVPTIRYVDKVVTREVPIVRVVERRVEVIKEVPVESIKEVPVYVKGDVTAYGERDRTGMASTGHESQMYSTKRSAGAERQILDRRVISSAHS